MTALDSTLTLAGGLSHRVFFKPILQTSEHGREIDWLFLAIWWISVFFFVLLMGLMTYFVIKYRRRPGVPAPRSVSHNTPLELAWTIIPLFILVWLFFEGFWGYMDAQVSEAGAEELVVKASQWNWQIVYPNGSEPTTTVALGGNREAKVFPVPAGRPVRFRMSSADVLHSFWIPSMRTKIDVFPNRYNSYWFKATPDQIGDHWLFCAEYCGDDHSEMSGIIRVMSPEDYEQAKKAMLLPDDASPIDVGKYVHKTRCASCHSVDGSPNTGPTWKDLFGAPRQFADGSSIPAADENYIRQSVATPAAKIVQGFPNSMTVQPLTEREFEGIVAYMKSISTHVAPTPAPDAAPQPAPADGG